MFEWDIFTDEAPAPSSSVLYAYDGSDSPCSTIESAPRGYIPSWDASGEWKIVISRHPVTTARLKEAFREAEKRYGQIKSIAAYVEKDGFRDGQTIAVLRDMGFTKSDARGTPHAVCYVRDLKKKPETPKTETPTPIEPKGWEKELAGFRTRLEYKKIHGTL